MRLNSGAPSPTAGLITALDIEMGNPPQRMSTDGTWLLGELTAIVTALGALAADHTSAEWPDHELSTAQPRSTTRVSLASRTQKQPSLRAGARSRNF